MAIRNPQDRDRSPPLSPGAQGKPLNRRQARHAYLLPHGRVARIQYHPALICRQCMILKGMLLMPVSLPDENVRPKDRKSHHQCLETARFMDSIHPFERMGQSPRRGSHRQAPDAGLYPSPESRRPLHEYYLYTGPSVRWNHASASSGCRSAPPPMPIGLSSSCGRTPSAGQSVRRPSCHHPRRATCDVRDASHVMIQYRLLSWEHHAISGVRLGSRVSLVMQRSSGTAEGADPLQGGGLAMMADT